MQIAVYALHAITKFIPLDSMPCASESSSLAIKRHLYNHNSGLNIFLYKLNASSLFINTPDLRASILGGFTFSVCFVQTRHKAS